MPTDEIEIEIGMATLRGMHHQQRLQDSLSETRHKRINTDLIRRTKCRHRFCSRNEVALLQQQVAASATKGIAIAKATEKIYKVLNPAIQQFAIDTGNSLKVATKSDPSIEQTSKDFFKSFRKLVRPADKAVQGLKDRYPTLSGLLCKPGNTDEFVQ